MTKRKEKSLKLNMVLNAVRGMMGMIFPLITFPYVSRILGVDQTGKYHFASSVIGYFILLAGLGIHAYAVREGARIRDNREALGNFANEMFSIHAVSSVCAYILFTALLFAAPKFRDYKSLLLILSLQMAFKPVSVEWLYSIYEDYTYITIQSIVFQFISLILLVLFVRTEHDVNMYAAVTFFSVAGVGLANFMRSRLYCRIHLIRGINWKRHMGPILVLFAMSAAVTVYVNSDITVLGFLCDDRTVGIYAVSSKIYAVVKNILSSVIVVSIPRLSSLSGDGSLGRFQIAAEDIYKTLVTLLLPAMTGMIMLNRQMVWMTAGPAYAQASSSLYLLTVALFFCFGAYFWGQCILVPIGREMTLFKITVFSACVNVLLNLIFIPFWRENAAALTTLIAEGITCFYARNEGRKYIRLEGIRQVFWKSWIGCGAVIIVLFVLKPLSENRFTDIICMVLCSAIVYFAVEVILKNPSLPGLLAVFKRKAKDE
jgi:O-antigen/teichoic acid export membrane protein